MYDGVDYEWTHYANEWTHYANEWTDEDDDDEYPGQTCYHQKSYNLNIIVKCLKLATIFLYYLLYYFYTSILTLTVFMQFKMCLR